MTIPDNDGGKERLEFGNLKHIAKSRPQTHVSSSFPHEQNKTSPNPMQWTITFIATMTTGIAELESQIKTINKIFGDGDLKAFMLRYAELEKRNAELEEMLKDDETHYMGKIAELEKRNENLVKECYDYREVAIELGGHEENIDAAAARIMKEREGA